MNNAIVKIYVSLLDEGTPTWRPTRAVDLGNGLYRLLATPDYDPDDEIWEFLPGATVLGKRTLDDKGEDVLVAVWQSGENEAG